jgi:hypothetical protein
MSLKWKVVKRIGEPSAPKTEEIQRRMSKLERLLENLPTDAVHLQVILNPPRA